MPQRASSNEPQLPEAVRQRIAQDLAAGRTIALPPSELARADVREHLPELLADLGRLADGGVPRLQVPGYQVLGEIGHGGMSTVYLANHEALGRHVALKIVPNWLGGQERARERLLNEARAMARLSHPNIVTIHDIVEHGDTVAIAMEWIDGLTLAGLLRALPEQPCAEDMVILRTSLGTGDDAPDQLEATATRTFVRMMVGVAQAVHHVHQHGLLHLDIKPSNVLVRRDGTPLLADFGVVREIDLALTHTHSFAGTPIYAAPEQLRRDDRSFGPRTDVYGLGITLYELLARCQPLRQEGLTKMLQDIQAGRIPALATRAQVPEDLANIVHKAISPDPARRYESAAAFAQDLQAFLDGRQVSARPLTRLERAQRWVRAEPWKAMVAGVLLVLVPISVGLGGKLLAELPRSNLQLEREQREHNAELVHTGFQRFLITERDHEDFLAELRRARAKTPKDPNLVACLCTMLSQDQPAACLAEIQLAKDDGHGSPGLTALEERVRRGGLFFDEATIEALRNSKSSRLDRLLAILDRIRWQLNTQTELDLPDLAQDLEMLMGIAEPDPLLRGLRTWVAALEGDRATLRICDEVLASRWPDDIYAQSWRLLAKDLVDPTESQALARELLQQHDGSALLWGLLARSHRISGKLAESLAAYEECQKRAKKPSFTVACYQARALADLGKVDEAKACLPPQDPTRPWPSSCRLLAEERIDPAAAEAQYRQLLTGDRPPLVLLVQGVDFALEKKDAELVEALCRRGRALFPERHAFRWTLADMCWRNDRLEEEKRHAEAAELLRGLVVPKGRVDYYGLGLAKTLVYRREWSWLLQHSGRWAQFSKTKVYLAKYFQGLAHARLGHHDEAAACFAAHKQLAVQDNPTGKARHYFESFAEDLGLRVDPQRPASQRYPQVDRQLCEHLIPELESRNRTKRNPWWSLILAEFHDAGGNRDKALDYAKLARGQLPSAAAGTPADLAERIDAAITRFSQR